MYSKRKEGEYMFNHCGSNHHAFRSSDAVSCPTPGPITVPFPGPAGDQSAFAVQDGAIPQTILALALLPTGPVRTAIAFDRLLPPLPNAITVTPATPTPPGLTGTLIPPAGAFTAVRVTTSGIFDITAGLSVLGAALGLLGGNFTAEVVRFPGGIGTDTPQTIASIPLSSILNIGILAAPLLRGTIRVPDVPLNAGDAVQIQIIQNATLAAASVLLVTYAFLEIE